MEELKKLRLKLRSNKGQAIFEFILFLPFMLVAYSLTVTLVNSINGSINQQKTLRGYFYQRLNNNSNYPGNDSLRQLVGVRTAGMVVIGWREKLSGESPVAPCYRLKTMTAPATPETCDDNITGQPSTQFVRVKTVYGLCGTTYNIQTSGVVSRSALVATAESCTYNSNPLGELVGNFGPF